MREFDCGKRRRVLLHKITLETLYRRIYINQLFRKVRFNFTHFRERVNFLMDVHKWSYFTRIVSRLRIFECVFVFIMPLDIGNYNCISVVI